MNYTTFVENMREQVEENLGKGYEVQIITNPKLNGTEKTGLSISKKKELNQAVPVIYLEECFERYLQDGKFKECVEEICETYRNQTGNENKIMAELESIKNIKNWEGIKDRVYPILVSAKENENLKETFLYQEYLDFLVLYTIRVTEIGVGSVKITKQMVKSWEICEDEIYRQAFENLKKDGYQVRGLSSVVKECISGITEDTEEDSKECEFMYVLTNQEKYFGAAGIFLCAEMFQEIVGKKNFYILPSSIHELILIVDTEKFDESELNSMVRQVNREQVLPEEVLSDHVYYYNRETRQMESRE